MVALEALVVAVKDQTHHLEIKGHPVLLIPAVAEGEATVQVFTSEVQAVAELLLFAR
jgi:hypothetical protein